MGEFAEQLVQVAGILKKRAAQEQGGVISGANPVAVDLNDPIKLWVVQVVIIIAMVQFLALGLSRIRQPRVIAEVIGGVLLGPSVMGHIPGFSNAIFPTNGMPMLTLTANIGLVLFLFLVGLEIDLRLLKRNVRASTAISIAGLIIPLGLGAALGVGVYREFISSTVNFGYFLLFTAVAIGITAFPVLCRILTELKLLDTTVGVVTLSAGIGNDVVGWILLALTVALVNASNGLTALYVLLASVAFVLFLLLPVKWGYVWLAKRTGSLEQGSPTTSMMTLTLIMILVSAFFTDIIGVHPIFGGFLAGLVIPHENGYAISLVEKLEDLVSILFLPIYFTLSGLKTNLGLLNNGITWGYIVLICLVAFTSKFVACGATAYASGFKWREAGAIGSLMSCKGLVELIVLNVGLSAKILDDRTFSMFVLHALILTFMTTPLTLFFYPTKYRVHEGSNSAKMIDAEVPVLRRSASEDEVKTKFSIVLDKIEQIPAAMTLAQLLQLPASRPPSYASTVEEKGGLEAPTHTPWNARIRIAALRLVELTNRTSAVLKSQEADVLLHNDPIVSVFRTFGYLNRIIVSAALSVVNYDDFPDAIATHAAESDAQMVIIPWSRGATTVLDEEDVSGASGVRNPFDGIFHKTATQDQTSSVVYSDFIRRVFLRSPTDVALFVDRGLKLHSSGSTDQHLFLPFIGGPDDRLALAFLVQLCANPAVTATVVRIRKTESSAYETVPAANTHLTMAAADTVYGQHSTETRLVSDTADNLLWDRFTVPSSPRNDVVASALSRISFRTQESREPLHQIVELVDVESKKLSAGKNLVVLLGRSRRMAVESHQAELQKLISSKGASIGSAVSKTVGDVGAALVASRSSASLLVLQATVPAS